MLAEKLAVIPVIPVRCLEPVVHLTNPDYLQVDYQYDQADRLMSRIMSSGARTVYGYDANCWLSTLTHYDATGATVVSSTYTAIAWATCSNRWTRPAANAGTST